MRTRRELILATRHILGCPFRQGFHEHIDLLLDERVLVGSEQEATDALRPLAYSFLAEIVHCVRPDLSLAQMEKVIHIFSTNVHDPTFNYYLQISSVRFLMNLIEGILKPNTPGSSKRPLARELLIRILETMVTKFSTLGEQVPRLLKAVEELRESPDVVESGKILSDKSNGDPLKEVSDFKLLLKTLTPGMKTVIWSAMTIKLSDSGAGAQALMEVGATGKSNAVPGTAANVSSGSSNKGMT